MQLGNAHITVLMYPNAAQSGGGRVRAALSLPKDALVEGNKARKANEWGSRGEQFMRSLCNFAELRGAVNYREKTFPMRLRSRQNPLSRTNFTLETSSIRNSDSEKQTVK